MGKVGGGEGGVARRLFPKGYLEELAGMRSASPATGPVTVDQVSIRFNVLGNLPADPENLITMLEQELEKGLPPAVARLLNDVIAALDGCKWCDDGPKRDDDGGGRTRRRLPSSPRCDAFAAWWRRCDLMSSCPDDHAHPPPQE